MMPTTRRTLLERVRDPEDEEAWSLFHELYAPLLYRYALGRGLDATDAEEIRDQCLSKIAQRLGSFEYDPDKGKFKAWLHQMARGEVIDHLRRRRPQQVDTQTLGQMQARELSPPEAWEEEWRRQHLFFGLEKAGRRLPEKTFQAFRMLLVENASVPEVCERLGMNPNQVYKAKGRVLQEVRVVLGEMGVD